jgi:hypothetical protein
MQCRRSFSFFRVLRLTNDITATACITNRSRLLSLPTQSIDITIVCRSPRQRRKSDHSNVNNYFYSCFSTTRLFGGQSTAGLVLIFLAAVMYRQVVT